MAMQGSLDEESLRIVLSEVESCLDNHGVMISATIRNIITHPNGDGMLNLAWLCSSPVISVHLGLTDVEPADIPHPILMAVAETLRKSPTLKVSENGKKVGRKDPVPDSCFALVIDDAKTLVASPIQADADPGLLFSFFNRNAKMRRLRKDKLATFCMLEFPTEEEALKALKSGVPKFDGAELTLKLKKEFDRERRTKQQEDVKKAKSDCGSYAEDSKGDICKAEEVEGSTEEAKATNNSANDQKRFREGEGSSTEEAKVTKARKL